jgi:hypothetical protein
MMEAIGVGEAGKGMIRSGGKLGEAVVQSDREE